MASRPYWSGQLKISLVTLGIQLFPATTAEKTIAFHQIDRKSGERVRHLNVVGENQPIESSEIVKGYEYSKGKYLFVEPDEIAKLRIQSKNIVDVQQFVDLDSLPLALFEKPYFVVPEPKESPEAFAVFRMAMERAGKAAIGEIAFGGREHLIAIAVSHIRSVPGFMAYMLRYGQELRAAEEIYSEAPDLRSVVVDKKQLELAAQLIDNYSHPLNLDEYKDDYEDALHELVKAKQENMPLPLEQPTKGKAKVVNLMDALRQSVSKAKRPPASERGELKSTAKTGPVLVRPNKRKRRIA